MCLKNLKINTDVKSEDFNTRNWLKFSQLTEQLITMEGINFKRDLIENFIEVSKSSDRLRFHKKLRQI